MFQGPLCVSQFNIKQKKFFHGNVKMDVDVNTSLPKINSPLRAVKEVSEPPTNQLINEANKFDFSNKKNHQKTLTWRSPLIFSPNFKFSPQHSSKNLVFSEKSNGRDPNEKYDNIT